MHSLKNIPKSGALSHFEIACDKECLQGLVTTGEHGQLIGNAVQLIIKNAETISEQYAARERNYAIIAKAESNIRDCIRTIETRLERLGAPKEDIATIIANIDAGKIDVATADVLKWMAHKNPGLYQRKYNQALAAIQSKQLQPQH